LTPKTTSIRISEVLDWKLEGWYSFLGLLHRISDFGRKEGKGRWRIRSISIVGCQIGSSEGEQELILLSPSRLLARLLTLFRLRPSFDTDRYNYIFKSLLDWLPHLPYVTHLSLGSNQLTQLPETFTRSLIQRTRPIHLHLSTNRLSPSWLSSFAKLLSQNPSSYGICSLNFQYCDISSKHIASLIHLFKSGRSLPLSLQLILGCGITLRQWQEILCSSGVIQLRSSITSIDWDSIHVVDWHNTSSMRQQLAELMKNVCTIGAGRNRITAKMALRLVRALRSFVHFPPGSRPLSFDERHRQSIFDALTSGLSLPRTCPLTPQSTSPRHDPPSTLAPSLSRQLLPPHPSLRLSSPPSAPRVGFPYCLPAEIVFLIADQCVDSYLSNKQIWSVLAYATDRETLTVEGKMQTSRKAWLRKVDCERWESNRMHEELDIGVDGEKEEEGYRDVDKDEEFSRDMKKLLGET
jgi:hypothetical protein